MICALLSLGLVVLLAANFYAMGYCFIHFREDDVDYYHIWIIYAVSIIFILLLFKFA